MSKSFKKLTYLNLTWCLGLTDIGIVEGVSLLESLDLLSVFGLVAITDVSLDALIESKSRYTLTTLDINGCKFISHCGENGVDHDSICKIFPNVTTTVFHS